MLPDYGLHPLEGQKTFKLASTNYALKNMLPNFRLSIPSLTAVIQTLERFQDFESKNRAAAIALYARQISEECSWTQETSELHLHVIANLLANQEAA